MVTGKTIFLAGDSTMCNYPIDRYPRAGWGQKLSKFLPKDISIKNEASSGRSSKSFINEGRLSAIESNIKEGDLLLIQFGHNDQKTDEERHTEPFTTFKEYLTHYINVAREKNAVPILLTPVQRRSFNEIGELMDTHGEYPIAIRELAKGKNVALIDLTVLTEHLLTQYGPNGSKKLFLILEPGHSKNYPEGIEDNTHFSKHGAEEVANIVAHELQLLKVL